MTEVFYVGIKEPSHVRRNVLEAMRDITIAVKQNSSLSAKRIEKAEKVLELQKVLREIDSLFNKLKRELPKTRGSSRVKKNHKTKEVGKHNINDLASQLKDIESKLARL
jgi:hypothetical protein